MVWNPILKLPTTGLVNLATVVHSHGSSECKHPASCWLEWFKAQAHGQRDLGTSSGSPPVYLVWDMGQVSFLS